MHLNHIFHSDSCMTYWYSSATSLRQKLLFFLNINPNKVRCIIKHTHYFLSHLSLDEEYFTVATRQKDLDWEYWALRKRQSELKRNQEICWNKTQSKEMVLFAPNCILKYHIGVGLYNNGDTWISFCTIGQEKSNLLSLCRPKIEPDV